MGCTEPIAVALSRQVLGERPDEIKLVVSRNIIKNVKSVVVPHTKGRKGLKTALCAGICYGEADSELEVLSCAKDEEIDQLDEYLEKLSLLIEEATSSYPFDLMTKKNK